MAILLVLLWLLLAACGIVSLVCFIMVLVKMFQKNETTMGIVCIVTIFCGIGGLLAFILGWINASKWKIQQIMLVWTGCFIATILLYIIIAVVAVATLEAQPALLHFQNM